MAPPTSKRQRILEALMARLEAITEANGFATDAGERVLLGEVPSMGDADPDTAICLVVGDDSGSAWRGEKVMLTLPVDIAVLAKTSIDQPWLALEAVIADVKRAVELPDRTLGGLIPSGFIRGVTKTLDREPGTTVVGAAVTYSMPYTEVWGHPEA